MNQQVSNQNKQAVISSAIVAKATIRRENGRTEQIVVFQESTRHEFYWIFLCKGKRSHRRSWKYAGHFGRDINLGSDARAYRDFGSFVEYYAGIKRAKVLTVCVHHTRRLASLLTKTNHESIHSDWQARSVTLADVSMVHLRAQSARASGGFFFNRRDRSLDNPLQRSDEVFVYEDYCEDCNKRHSYAHFGNGVRQCKLNFTEMKKNPGYEYRGYENSVKGFRFVQRTFVGMAGA